MSNTDMKLGYDERQNEWDKTKINYLMKKQRKILSNYRNGNNVFEINWNHVTLF